MEPMAHCCMDDSQNLGNHLGSEFPELELLQEKWSWVQDHDTDCSDDTVAKALVFSDPVEIQRSAVAMSMEHKVSVAVVLPVEVVDSDNQDLGRYYSETLRLPPDGNYCHLFDDCCFVVQLVEILHSTVDY